MTNALDFHLVSACFHLAEKTPAIATVVSLMRNVFIHSPGAITVEVVLANPTMSPVLRPDGCP
jgi:hypothetical protein